MNNLDFGFFIQFLSINYKMYDFAKQLFIYVTSSHMPNIGFHMRQKMETCPPMPILNKKMSANNK